MPFSKRSEAASGAVTLIQRFGSAANLNVHLHGLVLDGVGITLGLGIRSFTRSSREAAAPPVST